MDYCVHQSFDLEKDILADVGGIWSKRKNIGNFLKNYFTNFNFKHNKVITDEVQPNGKVITW